VETGRRDSRPAPRGMERFRWRTTFPTDLAHRFYRCFIRLRIPAGTAGAVMITRYQISLDLKVDQPNPICLGVRILSLPEVSRMRAARQHGFVIRP